MWLDAFIYPRPTDTKRDGVTCGTCGTGGTNSNNSNKSNDLTVELIRSTDKNDDVTSGTDVQNVPLVLKKITDGLTEWNVTLSSLESNGNNSLSAFVPPVPPAPPPREVGQVISDRDIESLTRFMFDLVQHEIDDGHSIDELHRVNNMAFEFIVYGDMEFNEAIKAAAEIVIKCKTATCEYNYTDVMELFRSIN